MTMRLYTIGFTKKSAERFFGLLQEHGVERLLDIRLHPDGQLAGFARRADLPFFLRQLVPADYLHLPSLAPSPEIFAEYRQDHDWARYVRRFEALLDEREIPARLDLVMFAERTCCLLCSEATPEQCHRRLVAERLARLWPDLEVVHLV
jgi:uncharacterized protein (DUF488 family)